MSNTKNNIKTTFKRFDQYVNGEISKKEFNMRAVMKHSPPMTSSELDNLFGELAIDGEDRVFGTLKSILNRPRSSFLPKPKEVKVKKEFVVFNSEAKKRDQKQLQVLEKDLEKKETIEDWEFVDNKTSDDDDHEFVFC
ncbi:unnamed protein product [Cochlearia groenlandica]